MLVGHGGRRVGTELREQWIVHDLNEPDESDHDESGGGVQTDEPLADLVRPPVGPENHHADTLEPDIRSSLPDSSARLTS